LKKIYLVLQHAELGEVVWRKEGDPQICLYERQRTEREIRVEKDAVDDEKLFKTFQRRHQRKEAQRARISQLQLHPEMSTI
jgi:SNF1-activating kinase 1